MNDDLDATLAQMGDIPSKADNRLQPQQDGDDDSPVIPMQSTSHVVSVRVIARSWGSCRSLKCRDESFPEFRFLLGPSG